MNEATATVTKSGRIGFLDTWRGIALIAMASYHFTWDLAMFGYIPPETPTEGLWRLYARAIASSFLFLAGFSLFLGASKGYKLAGLRQTVCDGRGCSVADLGCDILCRSGWLDLLRHSAQYRRREPDRSHISALACGRDVGRRCSGLPRADLFLVGCLQLNLAVLDRICHKHLPAPTTMCRCYRSWRRFSPVLVSRKSPCRAGGWIGIASPAASAICLPSSAATACPSTSFTNRC